MTERVVVTGLGVVSPFGTSVDEFAATLLDGSSAVAPVSTFDVSTCAARCAAAVARFQPTDWIPPLKLRRLDVTSQYAVAIARQALDGAGVAYGIEPDDEAGIVFGTYTAGGAPTEEFLEKLFTLGPVNVPTIIFNATVGNIAASITGLELKLRGPNVTVSQKEASGLLAIGHAVDLLQTRQARVLVAGGVDALYPLFFRVHDSFRVLSHTNGAPEGSRPFDATRNGFVLGEGGFGVALELASAARARRGPVLAEVLSVERGGATTGLNQWPTTPEPMVRVIRRAIAGAGLEVDAIDVVYASANSSKDLDRVEALALADVFGGRRTVVTSIKGSIGESSAAGAASVVAAIACARSGGVPPTAGLHSPDAACAGLTLATTARPAGPLALVNSVASGGALASIVLRVAA
ncbi:MAG TPA: beta-ketoacyl synthase N-terminal-like domain-containing protein [Vicinamibacterales bacterium]